MKIIIRTAIARFPKRISPTEAINFYRYEPEKHQVLMVMAAHWRITPEPGEEDWFEELTADEFEDEDFLETFADADVKLFVR